MFRIIGELINTTRKQIKEAVQNHDKAFIQDLALKQIEAGSYWVDVNGGARAGREAEDMAWLLETIQEVSGETRLSLDSNSPEILRMAYERVKVKPLINSISLETGRWEGLAPFLKGKDCDVLALCMDDSGLPKSLEEILERAGKLVRGLTGLGFAPEAIYIDPLIQPISTDVTKGRLAMRAVTLIMERYPGVHTCCGLSNISYGLPRRRLVNRFFLVLMIGAGLDSAILDPLDEKMIEAALTARMLVGEDRFCRDYLTAARAGRLTG